MNKNRIKAVLPFMISLLIMTSIFIFSSQNGNTSSELSLKITKLFTKFIFFNYNSMSISLQQTIITELHVFIRKLAHFSIYALLGFCVFISIHSIIKTIKNKILVAFLICVTYAAVDEIHQLYVPGRSGRAFDVMIDTIGSICGIIAALIIFSIIFYIKHQHKNFTKT